MSFYRASPSRGLQVVVALWSTIVATAGFVREFRAAVRRRRDESSVRAPRIARQQRTWNVSVVVMPRPLGSRDDLHTVSGRGIGTDAPIHAVE